MASQLPVGPRPLCSTAPQLLQTQLRQAERHLLCLGSVFGAINAWSPICAVRGEEKGGYEAGSEMKKREEKSPFMFVKKEERAVIITLEALDCNLPPLCVNLCIHQVFTGSLCKEPRSFCLHLSENTTDRLGRELAICSPHNAFTITSCVMVPRCTNSQIGKSLI